MGDSQSNEATVLPTARRGFVRIADPRSPTLRALAAFGGALVATLGGRVVALPLCALVDVLVDDGHTGCGRVRYVSADGVVAVHFGCDPLNHVWEFAADRCRATTVRGAMVLGAIRAHLATNPEVSCDLDDRSEPALHVEALRVEAA